MFQLIEKNGERKAVYSKADLEYMLLRGWRKYVPPVDMVEPIPEPIKQKRKYTRKADQ